MTDPEEFLLEDTVAKHTDASQINWAEIHAMLHEIPQRSPTQVRYLSEQLFMTAAYVCGEGKNYFSEAANREIQQADISDYIHTLKSQNLLETPASYPIEKEKELIQAIETGDKKASQILLNEILGHIFFSSGRNFDIIRARVLELVVVLSRAALDGGADMEQIFGLNYTYLTEINSFQTIEDLSYWLSRLMTRFTDCVFNLVDVKHVDIIYKSIRFMKENYTHKLTLEDVAREVHLSPSYFSRIFKEEMHANFNSYLNKIRIDRAKQFLLRDDINLVDISNLVGYEDQSYFSKVFKKMTGVSPGKFRELRGNIVSVTSLSSQAPIWETRRR